MQKVPKKPHFPWEFLDKYFLNLNLRSSIWLMIDQLLSGKQFLKQFGGIDIEAWE